MDVTVVLYSVLRDYLPEEVHGRAVVELEEGSHIKHLIDHLGIPEQVICSLNGIIERNRDTVLQNDDEVCFFRQSSGG
jgi:sulfur carrier protein ThiS